MGTYSRALVHKQNKNKSKRTCLQKIKLNYINLQWSGGTALSPQPREGQAASGADALFWPPWELHVHGAHA